jgi:hypothetical protein
MTTGLDTFDKTVQESNLWLKDVMERRKRVSVVFGSGRRAANAPEFPGN